MNGNYIFDSPIIPGYISTYGADKTNAHKEIAMINQAYTLDDIEDLKAELHHLEREFSLTGVTSEYDL